MTSLTWDAETLAAGAQLLLATTLAVHVLVVRPRAARDNLVLTAKTIGDDVTLDQNHGLLPVRDADVERVRQLLGRVVQDAATAKNVLLAADAELVSGDELPTVDRIRIEAYLTRLADACARYQHDAWPLNGAAQRARHAFRPSPGPLAVSPVEVEEPVVEANAGDELELDDVIDLGRVEPRRIDLDALDDDDYEDVYEDDEDDDFDATVERAAVSTVSGADHDAGERRITTRLRAQIDLTRLKQGDASVQVPTAPVLPPLPRRGQAPSSSI